MRLIDVAHALLDVSTAGGVGSGRGLASLRDHGALPQGVVCARMGVNTVRKAGDLAL